MTQIVDHVTDTERTLNDLDLHGLIPQDHVKQAGAPVYAWPETQLFPLHTAQDATWSLAYATRQAPRVPPVVVERLKNACALYNISPTRVAELAVARTKLAAPTLAEADYILPQYALWPVKTASDWRQACEEYVHQGSRLAPDTRAQAAVSLIQKAASLGLDTSAVPTDLYKRAGLTLSDAGTLCEHLHARSYLFPEGHTGREHFKMAAETVYNNFPYIGVIADRQELVKIAQVISDLDAQYELIRYYGTRIVDPYLAVFNTDKLASANVDLDGTPVPVSLLLDLGEQELEAILGADFMTEVRGPDGSVDPGTFAVVVDTLPRPLKVTLLDMVRQNLSQGEL
jgi:hypothetical protein